MAETCDTCGRSVTVDEAIRRETVGDLDIDRWQAVRTAVPDSGRSSSARTPDGERDR